jgi:hypothetical protein
MNETLDEVAKGAANGMKTKILLELDRIYQNNRGMRDANGLSPYGDDQHYQCAMDALHELKRRILELE